MCKIHVHVHVIYMSILYMYIVHVHAYPVYPCTFSTHSSKNASAVFSVWAKLRCSMNAVKIWVSKKWEKNAESADGLCLRNSCWSKSREMSHDRSEGTDKRGRRHFLKKKKSILRCGWAQSIGQWWEGHPPPNNLGLGSDSPCLC